MAHSGFFSNCPWIELAINLINMGVSEKLLTGIIKICCSDNSLDQRGCGTGFLAENFLITNHHIYSPCVSANHVILTYINPETDDYEILKLSRTEFTSLLISGSAENSYDFAILKLPDTLLCKGLYNFEIDADEKMQLCSPIVFPGFPFGSDRISIHQGHISDIFLSNSVKKIQIDGSINSGNSGGPLIDLKTRKVIGIITRSNKGLEKDFSDLKILIKDSYQKIASCKQIINIDGICPYEELQKNLLVVEKITKNLERSASTGIGYGFSIKPIWEDILNHKAKSPSFEGL